MHRGNIHQRQVNIHIINLQLIAVTFLLLPYRTSFSLITLQTNVDVWFNSFLLHVHNRTTNTFCVKTVKALN